MDGARYNENRRILNIILVAVIQSPVRNASETQSTEFIEDRVRDVLAVQAPTNAAILEAQYTKDIVSYMLRVARWPTIDLLVNWHYTRAFELPRAAVLGMTAAAAVGCLPAFKCFMEKASAEGWLQFYVGHYKRSKTCSLGSLMEDPLLAAVSTGKMEIVQHLLALVKIAIVPREDDTKWGRNPAIDHSPLKERIYPALAAAIKQKHPALIMLLCGFAKSQAWALTKASSQFFNDTYMARWLHTAAESGCMHTCRAVLFTLSTLNKEPKQRWLDLLFDYACEAGQAGLIRSMLHKQLISAGPDRARHHAHPRAPTMRERGAHGVKLAARLECSDVLALLLEHGGDINAGEPVEEAVRLGRVDTLGYMLRCGAEITPELLGRLDGELKRMKYKGLRSLDGRYRPLSYYFAAKVAEKKWPSEVWSMRYLVWLMEDVEDSAAWSARAKRVVEMDVVPGEDVFGKYMVELGF